MVAVNRTHCDWRQSQSWRQFAFQHQTIQLMKIPIFAACGVLALAVSVWCVRHSTGKNETSTAVRNAIFVTNSIASNGRAALPDNSALSPNTPSAGPSNPAPSEPQMTASAVSQNTAVPSLSLNSSTSAAARTSGLRPPTSKESFAPPIAARDTTTSALPAAAVYSNGQATEAAVLEVEPGVPVPASIVPPAANLTPAAAAAQQQLADSIVQQVNSSLAQPGATDATASQAYYKAVSNSNEQYRALYGNDAFNRAGVQATTDAQSGK